MINIFTLLSLLLLPNLSFQLTKPKICLNCKYFLPDNNTGKFGRCLFFPIDEEDCFRLVNGCVIENKNEYNYCARARKIEGMCGLEGKHYKKKYIKKTI